MSTQRGLLLGTCERYPRQLCHGNIANQVPRGLDVLGALDE